MLTMWSELKTDTPDCPLHTRSQILIGFSYFANELHMLCLNRVHEFLCAPD